MNSSYLRAGVALACALGLAACGGGGAGDIYLGGSVYGLTQDGLVLQNNGGSDLTVPAGSSSFIFPNLIGTDSAYDVTIKSAPANADCTIAGGKGTSGPFNVTTITVTCITHTHALTGHVSGLTAEGLVVVNGADRVVIHAGDATGAATFEMAKVAEDAPYGITILSQPTGLTCSIANGVGKMGKTDVTNVQISCAPAAAPAA
jgi:hypothetical protein